MIQSRGSLYVAVPDSSTITDRIYRWLGKGGGHVNPFTSTEKLIAAIERATGLPHAATRPLCTSLSFLNRRNSGPGPRKKLLLGGGTEVCLRFLTYLFRKLDALFGTHTSIYGCAFYFGALHETIDSQTWTNVCVRCGAGHPSALLVAKPGLFLRRYDCPNCGTSNLFTTD